jgi:putative ABC transport system permease protein
MALIRHYLTTLVKGFRRDLFYSLINLFGLAIGLASAFLIYLYVQDELNFDKHYIDSERIYRLEANFNIKGKEDKFALTQFPLAPTLMDEYPEIESYTRLFSPGSLFFNKNQDNFQEDSVYYADSTIFAVFSHSFLQGDPFKALVEPNTIVISSSMANKYFGKSDVLGETIKTNDNQLYTVKGVFRDIPWNTHMRYNGLISSATIAKQIGQERFNDRSAGSFWNINVFSFVKLKPNTSFSTIIDKFPAFYDKYMKEIGDQINGGFSLMASPVTKIHYDSFNLQYDQPKGNKAYLYILGFVGIFILIIACINYMNLATARSARRAREVGMRKVSGAHRRILINQFLGESVLLSFTAMIIAIGLIILVLPFFNEFSSKQFTLGSLLPPSISLSFIAITVFVGLVSGLYPALYLSSMDPVKILKGTATSDKTGAAFRRFLVVLQFAISVFMITGSLVVSSQLNYMRNKDLGFNKKDIVVISVRDSTLRNNMEAFKQELMKSPFILRAGASTSYPGENLSKNVMRIEGAGGAMEEQVLNNFYVDYDYIEMMGFKLDTGRIYSKNMGTDVDKAFVINEKATTEFNWHDKALGKRFQNQLNLDGTAGMDGQIIGVLKDFNYGSLHNPIEPMVLLLTTRSDFLGNLSVRIKPGSENQAIEWIRKTRDKFNPYFPFEYKFLDNKLNEYYKEDYSISRIFKIFTLLTLFVAALGLLGLSSFITQQKTREIGLRKVLGSTSGKVVLMFLKDFGRWVIIANIIAFPFAWYFTDKWLQDFYYKINLGAGFFIIAFLVSMLTALITVSWQSFKASRLNPAESLKYE